MRAVAERFSAFFRVGEVVVCLCEQGEAVCGGGYYGGAGGIGECAGVVRVVVEEVVGCLAGGSSDDGSGRAGPGAYGVAVHPVEDLDGPVLEVRSLGLKLVCKVGVDDRGEDPEYSCCCPAVA